MAAASPSRTRVEVGQPIRAGQFAGLDLMGADDLPPDYGRWLIHGPQGSGKTTLAATIAALGPTLFLDLTGEKGVRSFQRAPYSSNITVVRPTSITALDDVYWQLAAGGHPYRCVVLDSITAAQKMTMRYLLGHDETAVREIRKGVAPADMRTWGQSLDVMTDVGIFWFGLADGQRPQPIHVVFTAQTKVNEDDFGNISRSPDVQKGALSLMMASPDYILYTDVEENPDALADDSQAPVHHIVRFGANPDYRTKARLPYDLRGKIPPILGRRRPTSLAELSRVLRMGGVPEAPALPAAEPETVTPAQA
jgi:energy-coupling factor transporter ATP-binding protein EcfA2